MKRHRKRMAMLAGSALTLLWTALPAEAAIDRKFYDRSAETVWGQPDSTFRATIPVPDSLAAKNSAVILAWRDDYDVDNVIQNSLYKASGETNRMQRKHLQRKMVKLLDQSAVERYTEFEFGEEAEVKIMSRVLAYKLKSSFGARIHKPDGRIVTVDLSSAIEVGDGKKGKENKSYKIAIPGLEAGDVLDYFHYFEETAEEFSLDAENLVVADRYPVLNREIRLTTDPRMTVEYKGYNGIPQFTRTTDKEGNQTATLRMQDIPGVNFDRYLMDYRQIPFVRVNFLNNSTERTRARSARGGGIYGNVNTGRIYSEIGDYLRMFQYESPVPGKARKIVSDYFKARRPDASTSDLADAAYLAVRYVEKTDDDLSYSSFKRSLILSDVLAKLGLYPLDSIGVGFINPRTDVPTAEIASWNEPYFTVNTPDRIYYMADDHIVAPGELPAIFNGETGGVYFGERSKIPLRALISQFTVPAKRFGANSFQTKDTVSIVDETGILFRRSATASGGEKMAFPDYTDDYEWCSTVEDNLGIPEKNKYKPKNYDVKGRGDEVLTLMKKQSETPLVGAAPDSISALQFRSRGITPDARTIEFTMEGIFSGLVEQLGDDISVKLGRLLGTPEGISDNERDRLLDAMLPFAFQESRSILFLVPEGYKVDEASLEDFKQNFNSALGTFYVNPVVNEDGNLEITSLYRVKLADVPLSHWPMLRDQIEAAAAFADASVILSRK